MAFLCTVVGSALRVLALFSALNVVLETVHTGRPRSWVWVNLHWAPVVLAALWLAAFSAAVLLYSHLRRRVAMAARIVVGSAAVLCAVDTLRFALACASDSYASSLPIPTSALTAAACALWAWRPPRARPWTIWRTLGTLALDAGMAVAGLALFVVLFGASDYRRPADVIVVFGAGVTGRGEPSPSLRERLEAGCALYHRGYAPNLLLSGGQGEGIPVSEPVAMLRAAVAMGVPEAAIVLDEGGVNTLATVKSCAALAEQQGWRSQLMVSHDYHLARIKMFCSRQGLRAFTVPAVNERPAKQKLYSYLRELAAIATYYFLPELSYSFP